MVKFLVDENIPLEVVLKLQSQKMDLKSISQIKPGITDEEVLEYARKEKRVIITLDKDFGHLLFRHKLKSSGVILLQIHPQSTIVIYELIRKILSIKIDLTNSFCVVEKHRLRVISLNT